MNPNDSSLDRDRLRVVIATIVINVLAVSPKDSTPEPT
jgi:hypothetical protein